jgi:UDP:flavonoid glycosyltransferase YjiC (YdhE family)
MSSHLKIIHAVTIMESLIKSHCGMDSIVEGIYFQKPILYLPIHTDQFLNSIAIENSGVGESLFEPSSNF